MQSRHQGLFIHPAFCQLHEGTSMRQREIHIGHFYFNGSKDSIREVTAFDSGDIFYRDYSRQDGRPYSVKRRCLMSSFCAWAERECTPEEIGRCDVTSMKRLAKDDSTADSVSMEASLIGTVHRILDAIDTDHIISYLEEHGYQVTHREEG